MQSSDLRYSLLESEYLSPLLDFACPPKYPSYLIYSLPRSGSYYLCRLLYLNRCGIPFEYVNSLHYPVFASRLNLLPSFIVNSFGRYWFNVLKTLDSRVFCNSLSLHYLKNLRQYRSWNGKIFGVKLQPQDISLASHLALNQWKPLLLNRRLSSDFLCSFHFSRCFGHWDDRLMYSYSNYSAASIYSRQSLLLSYHYLLVLQEKYRLYRQFLLERAIEFVELDFDHLLSNSASVTHQLSDFLGLAQRELPLLTPARDPLDVYSRKIKQSCYLKLSSIINDLALPLSL